MFDIGDKVNFTATFKVGDALTNPTAVVLEVLKPDGTKVIRDFPGDEITNPSPGIFQSEFSIDDSGEWIYRIEGTGAVESADEGSWFVRTRRVI